ncbi:hypothetical protein M0Q97_12690 [Candidatus Dojkabacteria bacterium]|jgi:hypothetical protein|nr:hypothetical protein [Candidatus Dojkabacteria bacterium]
MSHLISSYKGFQYSWDYYHYSDMSVGLRKRSYRKIVYFFIDFQVNLYDNRNFENEEEIKKFIDKRLRLKKLDRILNC